MNKYTKIGIVTGFITASAIAVRCIKRKAFNKGFSTAFELSKVALKDTFKIVDDKINTLREQYDELEDDYYELEEEYFELLDKVECEDSAEEITE